MRVSERGIVRILAFLLELLAILQRGQPIFFLENLIQIARVIDADCVRDFPHGQRGGFEQAFRGLNTQVVEHLGVAFSKADPEQPGYMGGGNEMLLPSIPTTASTNAAACDCSLKSQCRCCGNNRKNLLKGELKIHLPHIR